MNNPYSQSGEAADIVARIEQAKKTSQPIDAVAKTIDGYVIDSFDQKQCDREAKALSGAAEFVAVDPKYHSVALEAAKTAMIYGSDDVADKALQVWSKVFDGLKTDAKKIKALESLQESVIVGTPMETMYNAKWEALPDSPTKEAARKTPDFYAALAEKFQEYGVKNPKRHLEDISPLQFDTRSWSDFVSQALGDQMLYQAAGSFSRELQPAPTNDVGEDAGFAKLLARIQKAEADKASSAKPADSAVERVTRKGDEEKSR